MKTFDYTALCSVKKANEIQDIIVFYIEYIHTIYNIDMKLNYAYKKNTVFDNTLYLTSILKTYI